jgi:hypothetical protein
MKNDELLKKKIEEDMNQIKAPASLYTFAENIQEESMKSDKDIHVSTFAKKKKRKFRFVSAAVIGLAVLTGSAFLNPAVAEMASKIPYLGQVFKQKPVIEEIFEALEKEGFEDIGVGGTPGDVVHYEVQFKGTKEDEDRERKKITSIADEILKSRGHDNYKITVNAYVPEYTPLTDEEQMLTELGSTLEKELKAKGYDIIVVNPFNEEIEVTIPTTETRQEEIKAETLEIAKLNGSDKPVKLDIYDREAAAREGQWMNYLSSIGDGLAAKKEFKVKNYGYSYKDQKMKIFIYTTMNENDPKAKETVDKITKEIQAFLSSDEVKNSIVGNETYELHITDKNKKDFHF